MLLKSLLSALGLVLVLEGILPFIAPKKWRQTILLLASQEDSFLRKLGIFAMLAGLVIVIIVHHVL
jgi:uncharacterized protein YjeT (DUF2065 family)